MDYLTIQSLPLMTRIPTAIAALLFLPMTFQAFGERLVWGSPRLADNQTSTAEPLNEDFTFQLGTFVDDFTPTPANTQEWLEHWRPAQSAQYQAKFQFFTASLEMRPFRKLHQGPLYIFGFDHLTQTEGSSGEWFLAAMHSWSEPGTPTPISLPKAISIAEADKIILGSTPTGKKRFSLRTARVPLPDTALTLDLWVSRHFTGKNDANSLGADPDNDGVANLMEFVGGTNPLVANETSQLQLDIVRLGQEAALEMAGLTPKAKPQALDLVEWHGENEDSGQIDEAFLILRVDGKFLVSKVNQKTADTSNKVAARLASITP